MTNRVLLITPVCEKILDTGASVVCTFDVPREVLLHFISILPREFTDYGGKSLCVCVCVFFFFFF